MERLEIKEIINPYSFEFKEAIFYCQFMFGLEDEEVGQINKQLMFPNKIFPDKIHLIVAKKGSSLVGFALFYYLHNSNLGYLEYICVLPEYRRLGIGTALYEYALSILRHDNEKLQGMLFEVNHEQEGLAERLNFFSKQGAGSVDVSKIAMFKGHEMFMFYHPFDENWFLAAEQIPGVMEELTTVWIY